MKLLEERILRDGIIGAGDVLKVDSFLNHQLDINLISSLAEEFYRLFKDCDVNKVLTIEASGIGISALTAQFFHCPLLFAKKSRTSNVTGNVYHAPVHSYTHNTDHEILVANQYLLPTDRVLIIDDFLAMGGALLGLTSLCRQAGATVVGIGIAVEKAYQPGGDIIRQQGYRVESLARIASMSVEDGIKFCE